MPDTPIRLAILEAETPIGAAKAKYGSYGNVFMSLFHKALDASELTRDSLQITGWDVVNAENAPNGEEQDMGGEWKWKRRKGYPDLKDIDAVLITGSRMWTFFCCDQVG